MASKTLVRAEASPVSQPTQNGEDADSARKCGRYWQSALTMGIAFSGARTPTCTCTPKICSCRASHCICSTSSSYRGFGLISCVVQSVIGWVPLHITPRPRAAAAALTSCRVACRSALASSTVEQTSVMISTVDSRSSCLAFGCSSSSGPAVWCGSASSARMSLAPLRRWRVSRSTSSSSHSTPRLERGEDENGMCTLFSSPFLWRHDLRRPVARLTSTLGALRRPLRDSRTRSSHRTELDQPVGEEQQAEDAVQHPLVRGVREDHAHRLDRDADCGQDDGPPETRLPNGNPCGDVLQPLGRR